MRPTILVSNDDGVMAQGIRALATSLAPLGNVVIVAPQADQSAVSHAMSLYRPLRLTTHAPIETEHGSIEVYSVDGTPTDAVYMAVNHVLKDRKPNILVSGINQGGNLGNDVLYSGTVSAAMEGTFLGIQSFAISAVGKHTFDFSGAGTFAHALCEALLKSPLDKDVFLNVNVPNNTTSQAFSVTGVGKHSYENDVDKRIDPRGKAYYWIGGSWSGYQDLPGTDCNAIANGMISVTPIEINLTSKRLLDWTNSLQVSSFKAIADYKDLAK